MFTSQYLSLVLCLLSHGPFSAQSFRIANQDMVNCFFLSFKAPLNKQAKPNCQIDWSKAIKASSGKNGNKGKKVDSNGEDEEQKGKKEERGLMVETEENAESEESGTKAVEESEKVEEQGNVDLDEEVEMEVVEEGEGARVDNVELPETEVVVEQVEVPEESEPEKMEEKNEEKAEDSPKSDEENSLENVIREKEEAQESPIPTETQKSENSPKIGKTHLNFLIQSACVCHPVHYSLGITLQLPGAHASQIPKLVQVRVGLPTPRGICRRTSPRGGRKRPDSNCCFQRLFFRKKL